MMHNFGLGKQVLHSLMNSKYRSWLLLGIFIILTQLFSLYVLAKKDIQPPASDGYALYSLRLTETGTYNSNATSTASTAEPQMGRAPLYPLFLAGLAYLDKDYYDYLNCYYRADPNECEFTSKLVIPVHNLLLAICLFFLFKTCRLIGVSRTISFIMPMILLVLLGKQFTIYRHTEAIGLPLVAILTYCLARYQINLNFKFLAIAAIATGLLTLGRPAFLYFIPFFIIGLFLLSVLKNKKIQWKQNLAAALIFGSLSAMMIAPWMLRNYVLFDKAVIAHSGVQAVLAIRNSYNKMNFQEGLAAFVYWIPGSGDKLAKKLFPEEIWVKYKLDDERSFRLEGYKYRSELFDIVGYENVQSTLLREIFSDPIKHTIVSIPMAWRGLGPQLWALPFMFIGLYYMIKRRKWMGLAFFLPTLFTLLFHAGITHFRVRYGFPMFFGILPLAAIGMDQCGFYFHRLYLQIRNR